MTKPTLKYAEFYVTNVCNLDCPQCNRFNNRKFKGHYKFNLGTYQRWAECIHLESCNILGGEPTLNSDLPDWIRGIHQCWPNAVGKVVSNGTRLTKLSGLADALANTGWTLDICVHNPLMRSYVLGEINQAFGHCRIKQIIQHNNLVVNGIAFETAQGITINIKSGENFHNNIFQDGQYQLHDSDPTEAHRVCTMKRCHHFIDGKLYKCGVVYLLPEYFNQVGQPVPELYDQYQPLEPGAITQDDLDLFSSSAIPQCKFCPTNLVYETNQSKFKNQLLNTRVLGHQG